MEDKDEKLAEMAENPLRYLRYITKGNGWAGHKEKHVAQTRRNNRLARKNRRLNLRRGKVAGRQ